MKPIVLILALLTSAAQADLVITEVMASSSHTDVSSDGDWWELTNTGSSAVNLTGYKWDDALEAVPTVSIFPNITIQAGESIIILQEDAANAALWKPAWGLTTTQVINRTQFTATGGEGFSNLSAAGDEVNLYNPVGVLVASAEFGASIIGKSQAFHTDGTRIYGIHSEIGKNGAVSSSLTPADIGSPGEAGIHFTTPPVIYGFSSYNYPVTAAKPGAAAPVISATGLPSFLTLTPGAAGAATLAGNRPLTLQDTGNYLIELTATGSGKSTVQEFILTILNPLPSVILNEYNAVAPANFLNGGTELADDDGGAVSTDAHFGRVPGNGGQWAEFVVVGDGNTGNVDMRGWKIEIGTNAGFGFTVRNTLVLSNDAAWQTVPTGTILTFTDKTTAQGGQDSGFALRDRSGTIGDVWSNIWMGDSSYLTYTSLAANGYNVSAGIVSGIVIDNNGTQFRVKNSAGEIVFGPAGEGIAPLRGTNNKEIFELEGHPTPSVSPLVASTLAGYGYDDGASESTFGLPNNWLNGTTPVTQRFNVLTAPEIAVERPAGVNLTDGGPLNLGKIAAGTTKDLTFTIKNTGTADLTGLAVTKDGTSAADFTVTANPTSPVPAPTGSTTFTVRFAPATAGSKAAAIHIASNDDDEPSFDINFTATVFVPAPEIAVQQPVGTDLSDGKAKVSFGTVKVGKTGTARGFTIKNTGTVNLTGFGITIDGSHPKDFVVTPSTKKSLVPGASTTFKVSFKPRAKGTRSASIHIKNNDANENPFDIKLTGAGA